MSMPLPDRDELERLMSLTLEDTDAVIDALVEARKHAGVTPEAMAQVLGVSTERLAALESENSSLSLRDLRCYAAALGMSLRLHLEP